MLYPVYSLVYDIGKLRAQRAEVAAFSLERSKIILESYLDSILNGKKARDCGFRIGLVVATGGRESEEGVLTSINSGLAEVLNS